ncbi:NifU-domain-containing protein [Dunaliella salina]|uniref:NifU-domain-containing protein n=1 Tax=Dunaliella salina TaxID=3046 RepID=A0ABQ7GMZ7_DUNSA|nr:NifU-domain-containing protein [Dunaliella salina]|eukprot:KAF5835968.1 NifU-domain-containing protein [Dunaliella salina]
MHTLRVLDTFILQAHDAEDRPAYTIRKDQDDGSVLIPVAQWLAEREGEKPLGVYALYNEHKEMQYVGYARNMVQSVRNHVLRVPSGRATHVRSMLFANKAMATRDQLEQQATAWIQEELGKEGAVPPGNGPERDMWEGTGEYWSGRQMTEAEAEEHADKAAKLRRAMGEVLLDDLPATGDEDTKQRRLNTIKAMEGGDWSEVIDKQTTEAIGGPTPAPEPATSSAAASSSSTASEEAAASSTEASEEVPAEQPIASPFARAQVHRTVGESTQGATKALTLEAADQVLNEVRPYLIDDGGDVEVVNVEDGVVSLKLQGACGTCASSGATMKMGIERALKAAFGDALKEVVQVDKIDVTSATIENVDMHLNMLRGAVTSMGGSVDVLEVTDGVCKLKYKGPAPIAKGVSAAIRDQFPDIQEVQFT